MTSPTPSLDDLVDIILGQVRRELRQQLAGVVGQRDQLAAETVSLREENKRLVGRIFGLSMDDSQLCHQHEMPPAMREPQDDH